MSRAIHSLPSHPAGSTATFHPRQLPGTHGWREPDALALAHSASGAKEEATLCERGRLVVVEGPPPELSRLCKARWVAGFQVFLEWRAHSARERGVAAIRGTSVVIDDVCARPLMLAPLCG